MKDGRIGRMRRVGRVRSELHGWDTSHHIVNGLVGWIHGLWIDPHLLPFFAKGWGWGKMGME